MAMTRPPSTDIAGSAKNFLRRHAQALGWYEGIGMSLARLEAWRRSVRISEPTENAFCLTDRRRRKLFLHRRHAIYLVDFVKYFDFFFDGVVPDANNEVHFEAPGWHTPRHWGRPLFFTSFAESEEITGIYLEHAGIQPGGVVADLGAYCGLTSLAFAKKVGATGRVFAFEADPGNFAALRTNLEKYPEAQVTAENVAVWKEAGEVRFQAEGTLGSSIESFSHRTNATVAVRAVRLPDFLAAQKIERLDLIKMDVEGAETDILATCRDLLRRFRPVVIVEAHRPHGVSTADACAAILHEEGYRTYQVLQPGTKSPLVVGKPD
jgi:FkbM family methyltransferase